jgi:hypothetical protein
MNMILQRASEDAEHAPWPASEAREMEAEFDTKRRAIYSLRPSGAFQISSTAFIMTSFPRAKQSKLFPMSERFRSGWRMS